MSLGSTWQWLTPLPPPTAGPQKRLMNSYEPWAVEPRALYTSISLRQGASSMTLGSGNRLPPGHCRGQREPSRRAFFSYSVAELDRWRRELRDMLLIQCSSDTSNPLGQYVPRICYNWCEVECKIVCKPPPAQFTIQNVTRTEGKTYPTKEEMLM